MPRPVRCGAMALAAWALSCAAPSARADITPEAKAVVERYVAAAGGWAAFDSLRTQRTDAHVEAFGLTGTSTTYAERPDRRASYTRLGPFSIPEGVDGTTGWRVDPSGKLILLDGKDLEDARASAWFENVMWLRPDQGGGKVRVAATEKEPAGSYTVLEVTPPAGRARRFWFSALTGLIERESMREDQQTVEGSPTDYRPVAGRLMPFRNRVRMVGMPANDLSIVVDSIAINAPIDPVVFRSPAAESSRIVWLGTPGRAVIPIHYEARHVWVRARVNGGEAADFLLDTGASITILDSAYAARLGLALQGEMQGQGAGSTGSARFSELRTLRVEGAGGDGIEFGGQKVGVLSVNRFLEPFFWRSCAGVIGADFLSRVVAEIDYDREMLTLFEPARFSYAGKGVAVPFVLAGNMPAVQMTLDGAYSGQFRVDVGSSSTVDLHAPFVKRNQLETKAQGKKISVVSGGFGGMFTSTLTRMKKLQVGPFEWRDPMLTFSGASSGALASQDYAGNIGNHVLERFKCTFDYERRTLYLEPSKRFDERDRFSRSGVQLGRFGDLVRAMQVLAGSPADRAGLAEGDEVTGIDGRPAKDYTPQELQKLFEDSAPGTVVPLEVARNGKSRTLRMKLADLL